tara:strand:- start:4191 stop:4529 length:339 start_codon:yes stop_codon:yes gene_type:complete
MNKWDTKLRGPQMSGSTGNRIWKYQMPISEQFEMVLPKGAQILRTQGEGGYLWMWALVNTTEGDEVRYFHSFKAGGELPEDLSSFTYVGMASIYIQAELMLYIFEETKDVVR